MIRFVLILLLVLTACSADRPAPSPPDTTQASAPERAVDDPTVEEVRPGVRLDRLLHPAAPLAEVVDHLRQPRSRDAEPIPNRHVPGETDTLRTWRYDGLTLQLHEVYDGKVLLRRLDVTSGTYGTADGLSVGETRTELESILGEPAETAGDVVSYQTGGAMPTRIEVTYEADGDGVERASEIAWRPPID